MKNLIFLLIAVSLLFSQDPYRLNDSTFVYPCTYPMIDNMDSMTCYNFIALPLDAGFTRASDLDTIATDLDVVAKWNLELRGWESACYNSYFGWVNDFNVETGQPYMINALHEFDFIVTGDSVNIPPYNFMVSKLNPFMVPIYRSDLIDSRDILDEMGYTSNCGALSKFLPTNQRWITDGHLFTPNPFDVSPGMGLLADANANFIWPNDKSANSDSESSHLVSNAKQAKYASLMTKTLFLNVVGADGNGFGYSTDKITFKAWIKPRVSEIMNQENVGCGVMLLDSYSVAFIDVGNFPTKPALGDTLVVQVKNEIEANSSLWTFGEAKYVLKNGGAEFLGFETVISGSGDPIVTDIPTSIDDDQITINNFDLKQNYPNPFNNSTVIPYKLKEKSDVKINIYNSLGEIACEISLGKQSKGIHNYQLEASELTAGIYYFSLIINNKKVDSKRMLFLK